MKKIGRAWLFLLLIWSLPAAEPVIHGNGLPQLKKDFSEIICRLLNGFELRRESRFLQAALFFSEIRSHPLWELTWGKRRQSLAAEQKLLKASALLCSHLRSDTGLPKKSEGNLSQLALEYLRMADRVQVPMLKAALCPPDGWEIGRVQKQLAAGQVLLKYVLLENRMLVFFIGPESAGYVFLPASTAQAVHMIDRLSEPLEDFANGRVDYLRIHFDMELAHRLFNVLLKKTVERFPQSDELFIIPDQELFKLPFEALVMGFNKNFQQDDVLFSEYQAADYVIQKYTVSYYLSFADFLRNFPGSREYPLSLAAFGHPLVCPHAGKRPFPSPAQRQHHRRHPLNPAGGTEPGKNVRRFAPSHLPGGEFQSG